VIAASLDPAQHEAVEAPFDRALAIFGKAGSGKTSALLARIERARSLGHRTPLVAGVDGPAPVRLHEFALEILRENGAEPRLIDDVEAAALFAEAAVPLLAMESDLIELEIDPEVHGLRSPERFLESAFRLQRRLSEALISADGFLECALTGATEFYAKPPNFAQPDLIASTKSEHRSSLAVSPEELKRQYRREVDLAKLLAQLYRAYAALLRERRCAPGRDVISAAVDALRGGGPLPARIAQRYALAFLDDAQDLTVGEITLLQRVFGEGLPGVTLAGDLDAEMRAGARRDRVFASAGTRVELSRSYRARPALETARPATQREEARSIAAHVATLLRNGAEPGRVAVLLRSVAAAAAYEEALLDRDIFVRIAGDYNVFADRRALDAIALLWNVHDPARHEWLLRTLEGAALALSDASLAVLCGEPADRQSVLFEEEPPRPPSGERKRDPERAVRLSQNVLGAACDASLSQIARERVDAFRAARERWLEAQRALPFEDFARLVWREGLAREGAPGSARARAQQHVLHLLLERMHAYLANHAGASLGDALADAELRARSNLEVCEPPDGRDAVHLMSVEAARGSTFDHVVIANVRPGAFPCWYAPDAFLFSPSLGMIPKDNVGDATTARTAKFTYYLHRVKARDAYNARERRVFSYALSRATRSLYVSAWGRPTRALSAPEFLEELR
jgi:superfamily I DNA/RNA helicase